MLDEVVREVAVKDLDFEPELLDRQQAMDLCMLVVGGGGKSGGWGWMEGEAKRGGVFGTVE